MSRSPFLLALTILALAPAAGSAQRPPAPRDTARLRLGVPNGFSLAAVGDLIQTHPLSPARVPGLAEVIGRLSGATVAFGNFESTSIDIRTFRGYLEAENSGLWLRNGPEVVPDLKAMGFDLVARANNHPTDWGVEGMRETDPGLNAVRVTERVLVSPEMLWALRLLRYRSNPAIKDEVAFSYDAIRSMKAGTCTSSAPGVSVRGITKSVLRVTSAISAAESASRRDVRPS